MTMLKKQSVCTYIAGYCRSAVVRQAAAAESSQWPCSSTSDVQLQLQLLQQLQQQLQQQLKEHLRLKLKTMTG